MFFTARSLGWTFAVLTSSLAPAFAAPDLLTNEYTHDERCAAAGEPFSLKSRTAFERGFHSGDVDIESGVARFSLWGSFMDIATVTVSNSNMRLRKIDTRNGPHNVSRGCPAEYATVTFELTTPPRQPGSLLGNLVVVRPTDTWTVALKVHASPTALQLNWDQIPGAAATSTGSTRPISVISTTGCQPNDPNCGTLGSVQAPPAAPSSSGGGSVTSHVFGSLKRCLAGQGGDATLESPTRLLVKVPRDRVVTCQEKVRADHRVTERGVDIQARREPDQFVTRVSRSAPSGAYLYGITDAEDVVVGFQWDQIRERFRPLANTVTPPTLSPAVGTAINERVGATRPALPPPAIEAEIEVKLNGRVHAPLMVRIEPAQ